MTNFEFDIETQRFIINRWRTGVGQKITSEIEENLKSSGRVRNTLDHYVLERFKVFNPYEFPIYPKNQMADGEFWVLTQDDLRGIVFYNVDFSCSRGFSITSLDYCTFYNCDFSDSIFEKASLSYANFEKCNFKGANFYSTGGEGTKFINCNFSEACFMNAWFTKGLFFGSDFSKVYFGGSDIRDFQVNYLTKFDTKINQVWEDNSIPTKEIPDILRAIRISYGNAELWSQMDTYFYEEKLAERKYIMWPNFIEKKTLKNFSIWLWDKLIDIFSGYGTKPTRLLLLGVTLIFFFSGLYFFSGSPTQTTRSSIAILESIYLSITSFTTLGFGDIVYGVDHPCLRILSSSEAFLGATTISLFVVVFARKIFR